MSREGVGVRPLRTGVDPVAWVVMWTQAIVLLAQDLDTVNRVEPDKPWIAVAMGIVLVIGVLVPSFMSPRRTHQD
jgi:hypothetical protein